MDNRLQDRIVEEFSRMVDSLTEDQLHQVYEFLREKQPGMEELAKRLRIMTGPPKKPVGNVISIRGRNISSL